MAVNAWKFSKKNLKYLFWNMQKLNPATCKIFSRFQKFTESFYVINNSRKIINSSTMSATKGWTIKMTVKTSSTRVRTQMECAFSIISRFCLLQRVDWKVVSNFTQNLRINLHNTTPGPNSLTVSHEPYSATGWIRYMRDYILFFN